MTLTYHRNAAWLGLAFAILLALVFLPVQAVRGDDLIEFLSGAQARGTIKEIRKSDKEFDFEVQLGGRASVRTFSFSKVHAVTMKGKRYVLTKKKSAKTLGDENTETLRTKEEVLQYINTVGSTPPDWFESATLDYPGTLDLDWPLKPPEKGWQNRKNVGQYKWDIINPNPGKWQSGIRLVHEIMPRHQSQPQLLRRDMKVLGAMYFELFQDYARAAFWYQKANVQIPEPASIYLAECYWRLGNKAMALDILRAKQLPTNSIKLLGDMGQTSRAVKLAELFGRSYPDRAHEPYLLAGDACRQAGRYDQAIRFYRKVLAAGNARNEDYQKRFAGRAQDSIDAINLFEKADVTAVADGVYRASSTAYNGPLEVEVEVASGELLGVRVTDHREKQFYAALTDTPSQILSKQSVQGIDATSRATITSQAIVNSAAKALAKGAKGS